jgi:hypothetical protein
MMVAMVMMVVVVPVMMVMMAKVMHLLHQAYFSGDGVRCQRSCRCWGEQSCSDECGGAKGRFHKHSSYSL